MNFIWPVDSPWDKPYVSQYYGQNLADYTQFGLKGHNGWDFPKIKNSPIYAVHDGWVIEQVAKDTGFGLRQCLRIDKDDKHYMLIHGHQDHFDNNIDIAWDWNSKKYPVKQGDVIGYVDSTGFSTGNHLHFGIYEYDVNGNKLNANNGYGGAIDPAPFFEENIMPKKFIINDNGKLGVVVSEGFTLSGVYAKDEKTFEDLKKAFEFDGSEQTINLS